MEQKQNSDFAQLIDQLKTDELTDEAQKLDYLLRQVAWTTGSEFLGEFGLAMHSIKLKSWNRMSHDTQTLFTAIAKRIMDVWPKLQI